MSAAPPVPRGDSVRALAAAGAVSALVALGLVGPSCGARPARTLPDTEVHAPPPAVGEDGGAAPPGVVLGRPGRVPLGRAAEVALDVGVEPMDGEAAVLLVSEAAEERVAWVRRLDGKTDEL